MSNGQDCLKPRQGKYRAKVISTEDPTMSGKLLCEVPSLPGMLLNWATPSVPYAGIEQGMFALPEEGADVWVEFEGGNPDSAVWSGGYWETGMEPVMPELAPEAPELVNVFRSKFCTLIMNDTPEVGGITLSTLPPATTLPVMLTMSSLGLNVTVGELTLTMNPETGITLTAAESVMTLTPALQSVAAPTIAMTAEAAVNVEAPATSVKGNATITGPFEVAGPSTLTEETTVAGTLTVVGATEMTETTVTGALTTAGDANFAGALVAAGDANFAGGVQMEGDLNVLGAQQTEGNNATAGTAEALAFIPPFP
jgi:hypothetical protein